MNPLPSVESGPSMRRPTSFEEKVYQATMLIPEGRVSTYREIGSYVGCGSSQAIGQALKRNPYAPEVPCHRVIASDLKIGGFAGRREGGKIDKKLRLLQKEGVEFKDGRLVEESRMFQFS